MKSVIRLFVAAVALAAAPAFANFHLWSMSELYSSADGSVQFIELRALTGSQQFLTGHSLHATGSGGDHLLEFDHDLPGDTSGKTFLVGTQSFANLHVVAPDYIVPDHFFTVGGGTVTFAEGADVWNYGALPTDGRSLNRDGSTATNSPRSFSGATGTVSATVTPPSPPFNVHGLWWNDPDDSEPGWGINLVQQGDALFMSWFTYDTDGSGMWLFMSNTTKGGANTYTGDINRNSGAPFSSYDPSRIATTKVGTGTFTFTDASHGAFQYTVNGLNQTKQIKRFAFANPQPTCDETGASGASLNLTDLYWRSTESGWGLNIVHQGDQLFLSWFTYGADGKGMWLFASSVPRTGTNTYSGDLFRNTGPAFGSSPWNRSLVVPVKVGTVTLVFNGSNGTFTYTVDNVTQTKQIERFVFASPPSGCRYP